MSSSVKNLDTKDFMDPHSVSQLPDHAAFFAEFLDSLCKKFRSILLYSAKRYQVPNISQTKYCHFAKWPAHENLIIDEHISIGTIDPIKGFKYLGILFFPTDIITDIIAKNLNKRVGNISKFYAWLNSNTPIDVKLIVLDNCLFSSISYGVETWGEVSCIEKKLLDIEMKALKSILKVKIGTTNDLILRAILRCIIITKI